MVGQRFGAKVSNELATPGTKSEIQRRKHALLAWMDTSTTSQESPDNIQRKANNIKSPS